MEELAAFLKARLDEDEIRARAALGEWDDEAARYEWEDLPADSYVHARNHDPARVLREAEAKGAILADYQVAAQSPYDLPEGVHDGRDDSERLADEAIMDTMEAVVRALATVYSDHPDYQKEWAP
jgi:Family of unknown function (DUF6221)